MLLRTLLAGFVAVLAVPASASAAASVAYTDGGNVMLAAPDGSRVVALTTDGTPVAPYYSAASSANGVTVAARQEQFDTLRPVLHKWGPSGVHEAANVMPASSFATALVAPIGLDIDERGETVAFGYSYCQLGSCINRSTGYWFTFADHGPAMPSAPQGSSGLLSPSFSGSRIVSSDGFKIMVQEADHAPFNDGHAGWITPGNGGAKMWAAEVAPGARQIAIEYSDAGGAFGIVIASGDGALGGATELRCFLPTAASAGDVSWSPDGSMIAWDDAEGVKVAGAPDLSVPPVAGDACVLSSPARVLSATGVDPNFGGADVTAIKCRPDPVVDDPTPPVTPALAVKATVKLKRAFKAVVSAPGAGAVTATLQRGRKVVGSGSATAAGAGDVRVRVKLKRGVKPRALRGRTLTLAVTWRGADGAVVSGSAQLKAK